MKRRLTVSILLAVAAALLLAGVGTLLLARFGARRAAEDELRSQAETTADLVAFGQTQLGSLSAGDIKALQLVVCTENASSTATPQAKAAAESLRASVCVTAASANPLVRAQRQLCGVQPTRIEKAMTDDMRRVRTDFCREPDNANLDRVRTSFCAGADEALIAQIKRIRTNLCQLVSSTTQPTRQGLQDTLSKESIHLVTLTVDGQVAQGDLPDGVTVTDLRPEQLRLGDSVSGPLGAGAYAASAIDPGAETLAVVVIARPTDSTRAVVPWFLLASGITLLIGVVVANSLARKVTAPLREAMDATARIADGQLGVRIAERPGPPNPNDELEALAHSINAMAAALERSRGLEQQFLLSVSHDLRTPLTSIRGYAEAIADGAAPDVTRAGAVILAESRRLERLVKDLLELAKLDARRFTFHLAPTDLGEIAQDSVDGFRREVDAAGLALDLVPATAPTLADTDPDRLQQVIANLVENALKFARSRITVRVVSDPSWPRLEVEDDGPGIAAEDLPHVFERLYVAAATPQRKETGSGLGLAIVRELVEAMGGAVHAMAAADGQGTRMVVTLPAHGASGAPR